MCSSFWFLDQERNQHGPLEKAEIVRAIREARIDRQTQIWAAGMKDWRAAGEVENFASLFGPPPPPPLNIESGALITWPAGPMKSSLPMWGLFGRGLLVVIGYLLIIPSPWTSTSFYKWISERIALPNGTRLSFAGKPGDIWYVFLMISAASLIAQISVYGLVIIPLTWILQVRLFKWFCANLGSEDEHLKLSFDGGYWNYVGWNLLLVISFATIVGWAWVLKFMLRWICQNVKGTPGFEFTATGFSILWRSLVFILLFVLVIPIPWALRWYTTWYISQVSTARASDAAYSSVANLNPV